MRAPGRTRRIIFWGVMLLVPLMILLVAEGALRLLGVAAPPPLFTPVRHSVLDGFVTNAEVGARYFPPAMRAIMPRLGFQHFPRRKDAQTFRFFCLGGSSMAGFPYHTHAAFSGRLAARLKHLLPRRNIEMVNCAMTAVGSHTAVDFLSAILEHEPDLILIYMGHNEFYGAYGVGSITSLGRQAWVTGIVRGLLDLRLTALLRRTLKIGHARESAAARGNVMDTMAGEREIPPDSPLRAAAEGIFARNLRRIIREAQERGVTVMVCSVASNLRDQPPFGSAHAAGFAAHERFTRFLAAAETQHAAGNLAGALHAVEAALALDGRHAGALYLQARVLDALGRGGDAARAYAAARDYDTIPFRAPEGINRAIRREAARAGAALVAVDSLLAAHAPQGIPGGDFFLEHLHLSPRGNDLVAERLARRLCDLGLIAPRGEWRWDAALSAEQYAALAGVTELDLEIGDRRVHMLRQKWPYRQAGGRGTAYRSSREERVVELAADVIRKRIELNEAHSALGDYFAEEERIPEALAEYLSAYRMFPFDPHPARSAGRLLGAMGRTREARSLLTRALALGPRSEETLLLLGRLLAADGELERAAVLGRRALEFHPGSQAARRFLAELRARRSR